MARNLIVSSISLVLVAAVAGCEPKQSMVDALPAPNFNGPVISAPVTVAAAPRPVAPPAKMAGVTQLRGEKGWIPPVPPRPWKWIVIHHSASPGGNAAKFDQEHRAKGWDELGYDFVIGNGTDSGDGQIEVGPRWPKQKQGAHAKTADNKFNDYGVGICLVGNFQIERPTPKQLQSLARLTSFLMQRYRIAPGDIIRHGDTKPTECPGINLDIARVRQMSRQMLADAGDSISEAQTASSGELMIDLPQFAELDRGN